MWTALKHVEVRCNASEHVEILCTVLEHVEITRTVSLNIKTLHLVTRYVYRFYWDFTTDAACLVWGRHWHFEYYLGERIVSRGDIVTTVWLSSVHSQQYLLHKLKSIHKRVSCSLQLDFKNYIFKHTLLIKFLTLFIHNLHKNGPLSLVLQT